MPRRRCGVSACFRALTHRTFRPGEPAWPHNDAWGWGWGLNTLGFLVPFLVAVITKRLPPAVVEATLGSAG
eukprot:gene22166-58898_t